MMKVLANIVVCLTVLTQQCNGAGIHEEIYNGENATLGLFPYQVYLQFSATNKPSTLCGGSLISTKYILTAGHCTHEVENIFVRLGQVNLKRNERNSVTYYLNTSSVHYHPNYDYNTQMNDVSIIELPEEVKLTPRIQTINLPKLSWTDPSTFDNGLAFAQGWGQTYTDEGGLPHEPLQYALLHVMPHRLCQLYLGGGKYKIYNGTICTDKLIFSAVCKGDSGGGLTVVLNGQFNLIGAASWISGDCMNFNPGVFSYVPYFLDWIHNVTNIPIQD